MIEYAVLKTITEESSQLNIIRYVNFRNFISPRLGTTGFEYHGSFFSQDEEDDMAQKYTLIDSAENILLSHIASDVELPEDDPDEYLGMIFQDEEGLFIPLMNLNRPVYVGRQGDLARTMSRLIEYGILNQIARSMVDESVPSIFGTLNEKVYEPAYKGLLELVNKYP